MNKKELIEGITSGNRRTLAKAITLIESKRDDQKPLARELLSEIMPATGGSLRIGISGIPGVGKSTFIESFGKHILSQGHKIAVLAIDPSSPITGGSIMGDRTRMEELSAEESVFIRPSPSGVARGGVARNTAEVLLLTEAAGYDVTIIETMGVGQSEIAVASMVDVFLMLQMPGTGDELQGIKKGILELADIVAVTKSDGPTKKGAERAKADLDRAFSLVKGHMTWTPPVLLCSSIENSGIDGVWESIKEFVTKQKEQNAFDQRRIEQRSAWFQHELGELLHERILTDKKFASRLTSMETKVAEGTLPASIAASNVIDAVLG